MYVYIYIYIYMYMYTIYIYIERERERCIYSVSPEGGAAGTTGAAGLSSEGMAGNAEAE